MIHLDGKLDTDDMAFAVALILHGYAPEVERRDDGVYWTIPENELDEEIDDFIRDWNRGALRVEPRRFARELAATRKDVYRLMDISNKSKGQRVNRRRAS